MARNPAVSGLTALTSPAFLARFRASLCAALGLSAVACSGTAVIEEGVGGSGSGTTTTTSSSSGGGVCEGAQALLQPSGEDTGFAQCPDGTIHRVAQATCDTSVPACKGDEGVILCASDADCADLPNGRCARYPVSDLGGETFYCGCAYPCATDADCTAPGSVCLCQGVTTQNVPWAVCTNPSTCQSGDDCPSGECGLSTYFDGCSYDHTLACRAADDVCRLSTQCDPGVQCVAPYGAADWTCTTDQCAIGRPLLVDGLARTASAAPRGDWLAPGLCPDTDLPSEVRAALAAHFRAVAALEHASVGSFARFALELLAVGAPPELLLATHAAAADEVSHAALAYALASAYGGAPVGPSPLSLAGVVPSSDREAIVRSLVLEACAGETVGAAEARALAERVVDPVLAASYARIAEDEERHAVLGFRALRFLITQDPGLRGVAASALDEALRTLGANPDLGRTLVSEAHGLPSSEALGALRRSVLEDVVVPCVRALLCEVGPAEVTAPAVV
jgi:hypothetical protein